MGTISQRTVLLVEDSDDDAFFFERAFTHAGMAAQLVRATDGGAAVAYLEREAQSEAPLVFLDLKMPVMNGFEVLRWIRDRKIHVEVVVLSGSDIESDISVAKSLGARDYVVKPISTAELKRRLSEFISPSEAKKAAA